MNQSKIIGIDLDDVLFSFNLIMAEFHNKNYGTSYGYHDIHTFDLTKTMKCTRDEVVKRVTEFYKTEEHRNTPPIQGAVDVIKKLAKKYRLIIVTSRPDSLRDDVTEWVTRHFGDSFSDIHFSNQFGVNIANKRNKSDICKELGVEMFIEDATHYAVDVADSGIPVLLLDTPWNRETPEHPNITRVKSWNEIEKILAA